MHERLLPATLPAREPFRSVSRRIPLFSLPKACSEFTRRVGREASMRYETVLCVRILRYDANPSPERVFFRRRCNDCIRCLAAFPAMSLVPVAPFSFLRLIQPPLQLLSSCIVSGF